MTEANASTPASPRPGPIKRLYLWVLSWAESRFGAPALFVIAFAESSFFPIPPDVLQIALSVGRPRRSFFYALVAVAGSVLGGMLGWYIGHTLWQSMETFFFDYVPGFTPHNFELVKLRYDEHAFLAIFGAAFTPIPFKVFTIASGVFDVALGTLFVASTLGRGARFFIIATGIFFLGPQVKALIDRYFGIATIALVAVGVAGFAAIKLLL